MLHQQPSLPGYEMQLGQFGRREIIKLVGGAVVAWPGAAIAQAPGRLWKIGVLANESWPPADPFLAGERVRIADEMIKNKLPSIYSYHEHVRGGRADDLHYELLRRVPSTGAIHR